MSKKKKNYAHVDPITAAMGSMKYIDLKRACVLRNMGFRAVVEGDICSLQSWLFKNYDEPINLLLLEDYDIWYSKELMEEGCIKKPIHIDLRLAFRTEDEDGNVKQKRRDIYLLGAVKSKGEMAAFRPKTGTKKELTFNLCWAGLPTMDIIDKVQEVFPEAEEGSIKSWCSKARKVQKLQKEIEDEKRN